MIRREDFILFVQVIPSPFLTFINLVISLVPNWEQLISVGILSASLSLFLCRALYPPPQKKTSNFVTSCQILSFMN